MKQIKLFIIFLMSLFIFSSCETYSQVTYEDEIEVVSPTSTITYSTVITYGVPYYIDNVLSYYLYNEIYYYPYYWNNILYLKPYRYIQPRGFRYIPPRHHRPDYRFARPNHGHHYVTPSHRPNNHHVTPPHRPNNHHFGNIRPVRPNNPRGNIGGSRPITRPSGPMRSSTRNSGGHFGGRR